LKQKELDVFFSNKKNVSSFAEKFSIKTTFLKKNIFSEEPAKFFVHKELPSGPHLLFTSYVCMSFLKHLEQTYGKETTKMLEILTFPNLVHTYIHTHTCIHMNKKIRGVVMYVPVSRGIAE
jgi:hypothetical protein